MLPPEIAVLQEKETIMTDSTKVVGDVVVGREVAGEVLGETVGDIDEEYVGTILGKVVGNTEGSTEGTRVTVS